MTHDHHNQNITEANFEEWNESMARKYDTVLEHSRVGALQKWIESVRVRQVIKLLRPQEGESILDVGCGAGNMLELIDHGSLFGVDLSDVLLQKARQHLGARATLIKGNAENLMVLFPPHTTFTKIYSSEVLEHVLHPEKVIEQIHFLLAKDGVVVVSIPHEKYIKLIKHILIALGLFRMFFPKQKEEINEEYEWHLHDFDLAMLDRIIVGKFVIKKIKRIPFWFLPLRYVVELKPENGS